MKVTNEQVLNFRTNAERYIGAQPGVFSKFIYALNKGIKNTKEALEKYNEDITAAKYDLASKDEKTKNILVDKETRDFLFTTEARISLDKEVKKILDKEVDVEVYETKDIPDDLTVMHLEVFCPFVLTKEDIENKFTQYEEKNKKPQ